MKGSFNSFPLTCRGSSSPSGLDNSKSRDKHIKITVHEKKNIVKIVKLKYKRTYLNDKKPNTKCKNYKLAATKNPEISLYFIIFLLYFFIFRYCIPWKYKNFKHFLRALYKKMRFKLHTNLDFLNLS